MGSVQAQDLATITNLEMALTIHFRSNHYPPLPLSLIPVAIKIINGEAGDEVELPEGTTYKGRKTAPVNECIKAWHLQAFLLNPDSYEQGE